MYEVLLFLHSWLRWFVLGAGVLAVFRAYVGWSGRRPFTKGDNAISAAFSGFMWLQVIVGLGLYFGLSPYGLKAMKVAGAMKDPTTRFFGMEHVAVMILAAILAQVGRIALKNASTDTLKHKKALTYFGIALVLVLLMIPWGLWNPYRPLFRF
ncbi:hypothetical protein QMK33_02265 [Hymenobacter sp. H14-R3]|uniref:hypothetical protein n=1 Tax=Hymenobacter sp. H14-R3 TaxID=3046308 RepID=UPI0024BA3926|nr:hypothetical protein [Hymenobacter sp. H14-R3]MDJ0363961.1 hypothetical protein [Hymenobacter sp. H14-R3]